MKCLNLALGVFAWGCMLFGLTEATAQCTACVADFTMCALPNPNGDLEMKLCGDTAIYGTVNSAIDQSITMAMPREFTIRSGQPIAPGFPGFPFDIGIFIDTLVITDITGLPAGFTWETDSVANGNLYIPPASLYGCFNVCGQLDCESAGTYPVKIKFVTVQRIDIQGVPSSFQALLQQALAGAAGDTLEKELTMIIAPATNLVLDITYGGTTTLIDSGETITLNATPGFDSYSWSSGESTASINASPADTTTYVVTTADTAGCTQVDSIEVQVKQPEPDTTAVTGLAGAFSQAGSISVYPNPNQGIFRVGLALGYSGAYTLRIFNLQGAEVFGKSDNIAQEKQLLMNLSGLDAGVYLLQLQSENQAYTQKLIIH